MLDLDLFSDQHLKDLGARSAEAIIGEQAEAEARMALASVMVLVRYHGSQDWTPDYMPGTAYQVLIEAAARLYMNMGGFTSERADAVALSRQDAYSRGAYLTEEEKGRLADVAGRNQTKGTLTSVAVSSMSPAMRSAYPEHDPWAAHWGPYFSSHPMPIPYMPGDERFMVPYTERIVQPLPPAPILPRDGDGDGDGGGFVDNGDGTVTVTVGG